MKKPEIIIGEWSQRRGKRKKVEGKIQNWRDYVAKMRPWQKITGLALAIGVVFGGIMVLSNLALGLSQQMTAERLALERRVAEEKQVQIDKARAEQLAQTEAEKQRQAELEAKRERERLERIEAERLRMHRMNLEQTKQRVGHKKMIALTFDDGPNPNTTPKLLDILKEKRVKASFYVLGSSAQRAPELLKRINYEGHEIGNHTMRHAALNAISIEQMQAEIRESQAAIQAILGWYPRALRPPYGAFNANVQKEVGGPLIMWSIDTLDWKTRSAAASIATVKRQAFDGAIILMHDIHAPSVEAVSAIIDFLKEQDYELVTVSELAYARGTEMQNGVVYGAFPPSQAELVERTRLQEQAKERAKNRVCVCPVCVEEAKKRIEAYKQQGDIEKLKQAEAELEKIEARKREIQEKARQEDRQ